MLDDEGEVLFTGCEFGEVYCLYGLDELQTSEMIDYLDSVPNSRAILSYELYADRDC